MARGGRRTYTRDANGRFASAPGGGGGKARRPAARKAVMRAGNRLTRDNRGRITSIGGDGATARGGRLRTASGGMRARQTAALRSTALRSGTIAKGGRGVSGTVARSLAAVKRGRAAAQSQPKAPARARVGARKISDTKAARIVARVDARRPASQTASSSARRNQNALRTYQRATEFLLSPSRRALKRGSQISTNESVRRAVANAKPKSAKPAASPRASTGRSPQQVRDQRAMKAAGNYRRAAIAMGKGAMDKRTDVSLATASRALDFYRGNPVTASRRGLTSSGKPVNRAPAKPTVFRTRKQAAAAQLDRKRQISEIGERLSKAGAAQSLTRKAVKVNQRNLLTGGTDRVIANVTTQRGSSTRIGRSAFAKRTERRMERVGSRIDALVAQQRALPPRQKRRAADQRAASNIDRRLSKLSKAADTYRRARPKARRR